MAIWTVVANSARARFFSTDSTNGTLTELEDIIHPSSRLHGRDLETVAQPRVHDSNGPARHAMDPDTSIKEQQSIDFARELAHHLDNERNKGSFKKLYIIASPHFLGLLRGSLNQHVSQMLVQSVDKDLTQHSMDEIRSHLPERL